MEGKCYYCHKDLTGRTIKRHMKSCPIMKKSIEEKMAVKGKKRKQFIIAIKPKYVMDDYCIFLSIDGSLGLIHIDQFVRDVWVECCGHLSGFTIDRKFYQDDELNTQISEILNAGEKFEYEYDFGSTTYLSLEVVDIIDVSKDFTQIEIIARNNEIQYKCAKCETKPAVCFNYEDSERLCKDCIDEETEFLGMVDYWNSPRDGVCGYQGNRESENKYLPGNTNKYKLTKKRVKRQDDYNGVFEYNEDFFEKLQKEFEDNVGKLFTKGIYSFEIDKLVKKLNKDDIYYIASELKMQDIKGLKKKQLIDKFLNEYEDAVSEAMFFFDEERYKTLKKYTDNSGVQIIGEDEKDKIDSIQYFLSKGILFAAVNDDGEKVILMPEVVQNLIKEKNNLEYRSIIKVNSEIVNLYRGMNRAYGIINLMDISRLFKRYGIQETEKYRIEEIIKEAEYYYDEYEEEEGYFINTQIAMWWKLLGEIEEDLDYAVIPKEELLSIAEENWIHDSKLGKTFTKEFTNLFYIEKEILVDLMDALAFDIQEKDIEEITSEILKSMNEEDREDSEAKNAICNIVNKFIRNIRLWKYKGATINERVGNVINEEKKKTVGRNELCICGSGKKYKKCCGKNGNVIQLF